MRIILWLRLCLIVLCILGVFVRARSRKSA